MSPLGQLYCHEAKRLRWRYPMLENRELDRIITIHLALAFPTADAAELSQAMAEGSPSLSTRSSDDAAAYVAEIVADVQALIARKEDSQSDDT